MIDVNATKYRTLPITKIKRVFPSLQTSPEDGARRSEGDTVAPELAAAKGGVSGENAAASQDINVTHCHGGPEHPADEFIGGKDPSLDLRGREMSSVSYYVDTRLNAPAATAIVSDVPTGGGQPNGDQVDVRMAKIEEILRHAGMHLLEKCGLAAEWLHHAEAKLSVVVGQHGEKSAGRPEGALTRAARESCVPGSTPTARRKFMERALKIDSIRPEAQSAARTAGLDNIQSALLSIAAGRSVEAQLAKVQEIAARKAMPRRKSTTRSRGEETAVESRTLGESENSFSLRQAVDPPEVAGPNEVLTAEGDSQSGFCATDWIKDNVLNRVEGEKSSPEVQRRFARDFLLGRESRGHERKEKRHRRDRRMEAEQTRGRSSDHRESWRPRNS